VTVDQAQPRWQSGPRSLPPFAAPRGQLWDRIHAMNRDGAALGELAGVFVDPDAQ